MLHVGKFAPRGAGAARIRHAVLLPSPQWRKRRLKSSTAVQGHQAPDPVRSSPPTTSQGVFSLSTTAQRNLAAAQWSPNGGQLGSPDLTAPANQVFGLNVFGPPAQRTHLPKSVYARLNRTLNQGEPLD